MRWGRGTTTARGGRPGAVARGSVSPVSVTVGAVTVGAVLVLGLAGCAPEPIPPVPTTDRPSPTVEPTPDPEPEPAPETVHPQRPAAMDTVDAAGAEAAVEYFLRLYPYVYATGDLEAWRAMSHEDCIFCASVIDNVEANSAAGNRSEGGRMGIESITTEQLSEAYFSVRTMVTQDPGVTTGPDGEVLSESAGGESGLVVILGFHEGTWHVRELEVDSPESS